MNKKMLVTAGSPAVMIDQVRKIDNIFSGRTGEAIAHAAAANGWQVTLLTSRKEPGINGLGPCGVHANGSRLSWMRYRTFQELHGLMESCLTGGAPPDILVHSAAVNDYAPKSLWRLNDQGILEHLTDCGPSAGKVKSGQQRLFMELEPTIKLVDRVRQPWGFTGLLVKFKLQVGMSDQDLLRIARKSRADSDADFIVANCLEWCQERAFIINRADVAEEIPRDWLAGRLIRRLEERLQEKDTEGADNA